jgi:hypothetical protein
MEEIRYTWETSLVDVYGIGTNKLVIRGGHILYLYDVLYALDIQRNLFSIVIMLKLGFWFFLKSNSIEIYLGINFYSCGHFLDYFLVLDVEHSSNNESTSLLTFVDNAHNNSIKWYARFDHIKQERITRLVRACVLGPLIKVNLPFGKAIRTETHLQLIHSNICDPMNVRIKHDKYNFIIFIDDKTCFDLIYFISYKSEALDCFKRYINEVKNKLDKMIKVLIID